jgi:hypothetical protein
VYSFLPSFCEVKFVVCHRMCLTNYGVLQVKSLGNSVLEHLFLLMSSEASLFFIVMFLPSLN